MELFVTKAKTATGYALMPAHQQDLDAITKLPVGQPLRVKVTKMRNVQFHRKIMALINLLYEKWEPNIEDMPKFLQDRGIVPEKNWDRFRKDLIIRAGFFNAVFRLNGDVRVEAKSMSFGSMSEDDAEKLFDKILDVGLKQIYLGYTGDELREVVDQIMEFS